MSVSQPVRLAILGAGGLGRGMARMATARGGYQVVAMADSSGFAYDGAGLDLETILSTKTMAQFPGVGQSSKSSIVDMLKAHGEEIDAIFMALPNLPVNFFADTVESILTETPFQGVIVDALKRTKAVELLLQKDRELRGNRILYITGCGATPGFLTTVAAVAAQSFTEVLHVDIRFGVGIANWEEYKSTVREDFLYVDGFDAQRVLAMSDAEVSAELDKRHGVLELNLMEHADDIILAMAGVCPEERVTVGGVVDTRNPQKPLTTNVVVEGRTMSGAIGRHQFNVADEATMVDNVCGPAAGFMAQGLHLHSRGTYGILTSADVMPRMVVPGAEPLWAQREWVEMATV